MKKLLIFLFICFISFAGCETVNQVTEKVFIQLAELPGDSIGVPWSGFIGSSQSITSSQFNFTDADSMRVVITIAGTTNNTEAVPFNITYNTGTPVTVFEINSWMYSPTERTIDTVFASPNVLAFFRYNMKFSCDSLGGYTLFKNLKIYKK